MDAAFSDLLARLRDVAGAPDHGGDPVARQVLDAVTLTGPRMVLPSAFDVTGLATASVGAALAAVAELHAARREAAPARAGVDSAEACAAFGAERLFTPVGWELPPLWDPIAGNYRAADGWIRLHTNYPHHRASAVVVLGTGDLEGVRAAVAERSAEDLEGEVVAAGGAAAVMRPRAAWLASPAGRAAREAPLFAVEERDVAGPAGWESTRPALPLSGVRVLDLTRVIAGPVCTEVLAAYGADVLRIDPPGFEEVASLLPVTSVGKRTAAVDLSDAVGRATFEALVEDADVVVAGLRADALARLGYDGARLEALNPGLIVARLDAYGWDGPWRNRRGFDSLVQMSCGIAADGAAACGRDGPVALPVQALDHATGWLLAASIGRALARRLSTGVATRIRGSLIGTANLLYGMTPPESPLPTDDTPRPALIETSTAWGPARRVAFPGRIDGVTPVWAQPAGPLGRHTARWIPRE